jgi:hypothetical protein
MLEMEIQDTDLLAAAGTEGGRRPTGVPAAADSKIRPADAPIGRNGRVDPSNPQVVERPVRRRS